MPEKSNYQHGLVCLAEGFKELGIEFFASTDYWLFSPEEDVHLLKYNCDVEADNCDIVILCGEYLNYYKEFPKNLFHPKRRYITVYIDMADGIITDSWKPEFRQFDFILKAHYNSRCLYPKNMHPWAFGLTNRILEAVDPLPFKKRDWQIIANFRVEHFLRDFAKNKFLSCLSKHIPLDETIDSFEPELSNPYDYLHWSQSGRRHYPNYYERLSRTAVCAGFGGYIIPPFPKNINSSTGRISQRIIKQKILKFVSSDHWRVMQWDSWRFWESLAAGCVTLHLDFEKYNFCLPEMPQNLQDYVGVDLTNVSRTIDTISNNSLLLEQISTKGRQWALEHYSPVPTAKRLLNLVLELK